MKKLLVFLPFLIVLLSGCITTIVIDEDTLSNVYLMGKAKIDEPIVGGTVRVYDLDNNLLKETINETYKTGAFILFFDTIPADFRIEVTGGTYEGTPFSGHLYAEVRNLDPNTNAIIVSPVSTLISKYWQIKPETAIPAIEKLVKSFLNVDDYVRLVDYYEYHEEHFSPEEFATQMKQTGDFDLFIEQLLADLESGKIQSFASPESDRSIGSTILKYAVQQIGAGLIAWGVGDGADWILDQIIGGDGGDDNKQAIEQMEKQLAQIIQALEQLSDQMKEAEKRIVSEIRKNRWEADMNAIQNELALIDTMYGRLKILADSDPNKVRDAAQELVDSILDANTGIETSFRKINAKMIDAWDTEGLLKTWAGNVYEQFFAQYALTPTENLRIDQVMPYYDQLASFYEYIAAYQIKAANLLIEADHAKDQIYAEYFFNDIYLPAARGEQADIMREAAEYFVGLVDFYCNWAPWITVDPGFQDVNFTRILEECEKSLGGLGYYNNVMAIRLMWLSNYNGPKNTQIKPYFNLIRDSGLTFDLEWDNAGDWGFRTVEASESVLHLTDNFYTFDDGSKQEAAHAFRTYVLTDVPTATYLHSNLTIYGPVIIPESIVAGTDFGQAPINDDYTTLPYAVSIDQDNEGENQYKTWIVFLYTKEH
jgi:hypothetical protein